MEVRNDRSEIDPVWGINMIKEFLTFLSVCSERGTWFLDGCDRRLKLDLISMHRS